MLKRMFVSMVALLCGGFITIFGVFLSIFADGGLNERLILIAIVLLVLFILTLIFTYFQPEWALLNTTWLSGGGIIVLILNYQNSYYLLYIVSIFLVCFFGVITGRNLHHRFGKNSRK